MRHPNNTSLAIAQPEATNIVALPDPEPPPPSTPSPRTGGEGRGEGARINLGGIAKKPAASATKQKTYPSVPTSPDIVKLVDFLVEHMPFVDAVKTGKEDLAGVITPFYFEHATGRAEVESSVLARGTKDELMVVFPKQLVGAFSESDIRPVLGEAKTAEFFRPKWEIKVDGDKIPAPVAQDLVNGLVALFAQHGCADALSQSEKFVPLEVFHLQRHTLLTPAQNLALNRIARIKTSIKTRSK